MQRVVDPVVSLVWLHKKKWLLRSRKSARGFLETSDGAYAAVCRLTAQAGIDMKTYRYNNR